MGPSNTTTSGLQRSHPRRQPKAGVPSPKPHLKAGVVRGCDPRSRKPLSYPLYVCTCKCGTSYLGAEAPANVPPWRRVNLAIEVPPVLLGRLA